MIFIPIAAAAVVLAIVLVTRAISLKPMETIYEAPDIIYMNNAEATAYKLKAAINCRTISYSNYERFDFHEFIIFRDRLRDMFPLVHEKLELEIVNEYSLLYKWKGTDENLSPGLFMAHIDVVPVEEGTEGDWKHPPFSGISAEGFVWGRGAMDIKVQLITLLESCEKLLEEGFSPKRTIYFAFGHDEETDGSNGAKKIVEKFEAEGVCFEFVMDEGGCVNKGIFASVDKPLAFIGVAEKGYLNIRVDIKGTGGHASTPPRNSSLGLAAKAICRLEKDKMKLRMTAPAEQMIKALGRQMGFKSRLIIANFWLFKKLFLKIFTSSGTTGEALLRTTIAPTMARGSMEPNVLPQTSSFTVNCRILQGETCEDVIRHIEKACRGMEYEIHVLRHEAPSTVSPSDSFFFKKAAGAVAGLYGDAAVIPYLMVAGTDSIKFQGLCKNIIKFSPYMINMDDMKRIHGTDERISIENIGRCVAYYMALFREL
ncbi:MAG: M20/M25/M40 family metallo-hydrolase [Clostridia bacterium]|nr:M20/M25/M40 family metallo-hydrolase [Clostridia bacterium]